uniref:Uncharacterized protein n=1 Tax=Amphimedon queenslandica TaxID=400682 RepID=A0A1X7SYJ2_AMPQE
MRTKTPKHLISFEELYLKSHPLPVPLQGYKEVWLRREGRSQDKDCLTVHQDHLVTE